MHIKFTNAGRGNATTTSNYLVNDLDGKGIERHGIEIYEGNPGNVAQVANSLPFKNRYTHAVIAFAKEDRPTRKEVENVIEDFKRATFGNLDRDRFSYAFVIHEEEDDGLHIHAMIAKVDLESGKQFNPAEPGWQKHYDLLRDALNHEKNWARPDDPSRKRLFSKGKGHYIDAENKRIDANNLKSQVKIAKGGREGKQEIIKRFVEDNLIEKQGARTNADIVRGLNEAGFEVSRNGFSRKDKTAYMTLKTDEMSKGFRVHGEIYNKNFNYEEFKNEQSRAREKSNPENTELRVESRENSVRIANENRQSLEKSILRRDERYNEKLKRKAIEPHRASDKRFKHDLLRSEGESNKIRKPQQNAHRSSNDNEFSNPGDKEESQNRYYEIDYIEHNRNNDGNSFISRINDRTIRNKERANNTNDTRDTNESRKEVNFLTNFKSKIGEYNEKAKQHINSHTESINFSIRQFNTRIKERYDVFKQTISRNERGISECKEISGRSRKNDIAARNNNREAYERVREIFKTNGNTIRSFGKNYIHYREKERKFSEYTKQSYERIRGFDEEKSRNGNVDKSSIKSIRENVNDLSSKMENGLNSLKNKVRLTESSREQQLNMDRSRKNNKDFDLDM